MTIKKKQEKIKTTHVDITFGFNKNKLGGPRWYRRGKGKDLAQAYKNLTGKKYNEELPEEQRKEINNQIEILYASLFTRQKSED